MTRVLDFSDGFTSASEPSQGSISTNKFRNFVDDAAFVTDKGSAATEGDAYFNTTSKFVRYHNNGGFVDVMDLASTQTVAGLKTFSSVVDVATGAGGGVDVGSAGDMEVGASVGANTLKLGGATSTVDVLGDLTVSGTTTTVNTATLDIEDSNLTISLGGNDAASEGAGLTVDRTGTSGSLIYKDASATKFAIGAAAAEVDIADISTAQTLTNKTIDADNNTVTNLAHGAEVDDPTTGVHGVAGTVVGTSDSQTLTNKGIDSANNTITNIVNVDIKSDAAVARTKLASGSNNHVIINDGSGVMSSEASLDETRGGTAQTTYASGDILIASAADTLAKLPKGSDGQVLELASGLPSWQSPSTPAADIFIPELIENLSIDASVSSNAITFAVEQKDGTAVSGGSPAKVAFRNSTLANSPYDIISITSATTLVISSGSTLQHLDGVDEPIYIYLVNDGGTAKLAASKACCHDEGVFHTTVAEGGAGASDDGFDIYSTAVITAKPIRLIWKFISNQGTAGTWASVPTNSQPFFSALRKNRFEQKTLSAPKTSDGEMTDLTWDNLTIDQLYRAQIKATISNATADSSTAIEIKNGATLLTSVINGPGSSQSMNLGAEASIEFIATSATLTFNAASISSTSQIDGDGSFNQSFATLFELNTYEAGTMST